MKPSRHVPDCGLSLLVTMRSNLRVFGLIRQIKRSSWAQVGQIGGAEVDASGADYKYEHCEPSGLGLARNPSTANGQTYLRGRM